jgi:hypothetical protein
MEGFEEKMNHVFYIKQKLIAGELNVDMDISLRGVAYYLHSIGRKMDREDKQKFFEWL